MTNLFSIIIAGALVFIATTTLMGRNDSTDPQQPVNKEASTITQAATDDKKQPRVQSFETSELELFTQTNNKVAEPSADPFTKESNLASINEPKEGVIENTEESRKYTSEDEWKMSEKTLEALTDLGNILN